MKTLFFIVIEVTCSLVLTFNRVLSQSTLEYSSVKVKCQSFYEENALKYKAEVMFELRSKYSEELLNDFFIKIRPKKNTGQKIHIFKLIPYGTVRKNGNYFTCVFLLTETIAEQFYIESGYPCDKDCYFESADRIIDSAIIYRKSEKDIPIRKSIDFKGYFGT